MYVCLSVNQSACLSVCMHVCICACRCATLGHASPQRHLTGAAQPRANKASLVLNACYEIRDSRKFSCSPTAATILRSAVAACCSPQPRSCRWEVPLLPRNSVVSMSNSYLGTLGTVRSQAPLCNGSPDLYASNPLGNPLRSGVAAPRFR